MRGDRCRCGILPKLPFIVNSCKVFSHGVFKQINSMLDPLTDCYELLLNSINEDCPVTVKDGDIKSAVTMMNVMSFGT